MIYAIKILLSEKSILLSLIAREKVSQDNGGYLSCDRYDTTIFSVRDYSAVFWPPFRSHAIIPLPVN